MNSIAHHLVEFLGLKREDGRLPNQLNNLNISMKSPYLKIQSFEKNHRLLNQIGMVILLGEPNNVS